MNTKEIAADTLQILNTKMYANQLGEQIDLTIAINHCIVHTTLYDAEQLDRLIDNLKKNQNWHTKIELWISSTIHAIIKLNEEEKYQEITCLNFASAKNPGGGFINGAIAQEESIARASALYASQLKAPEYYSIHRSMKSCVYTDTMIFSPLTPIFKLDNGNTLDKPVFCNIITSAAVNAGVVKRIESIQDEEINQMMRIRIKKVLTLALHNKTNVLILGAWGCGVFQNNPTMIANLFREQLVGEFKNCFKRIVFAIHSTKSNYNEFQKVFVDLLIE